MTIAASVEISDEPLPALRALREQVPRRVRDRGEEDESEDREGQAAHGSGAFWPQRHTVALRAAAK